MTKEEWVRIFEVLDKAGGEPMLCDTPVECFENEVPCGPFRAMGDPVSHVEMMPAEVLRGIDSCMVTVTGDECGCPPSAVPLGSLGTGFVLAGLSDPHLAPNWWA